jgi:L,D-transpeptidase ErfK/SrfK
MRIRFTAGDAGSRRGGTTQRAGDPWGRRLFLPALRGSRRLCLTLCALLSFGLIALPASGAPASASPLAAGVVGGRVAYAAEPGDSLTSVSARFGIDVAPLAALNGLSPRAWLRLGQRLEIEARHIVPAHEGDGIWINIPQRYLFFIRRGTAALAFPVGLGRPSWPTRVGSFEIGSREKDKTWVVPKSIQEEMRRNGSVPLEEVPPGPDNPLGPYWLGLHGIACGIHGTIAPTSVYRFRSHGCIRARNEDAARLYDAVSVGEPVQIVYRPVLLAHLPDGQIWLEAHPDVYHRGEMPISEVEALARAHGIDGAIDWDRAGEVLEAREGLARRVGTTTPDGGEAQ